MVTRSFSRHHGDEHLDTRSPEGKKMEEPVPRTTSNDGEEEVQRRRRKITKHHGPLHLHRAQKKFLAQAGVFVILLAVIIFLWYWMAVRR